MEEKKYRVSRLRMSSYTVSYFLQSQKSRPSVQETESKRIWVVDEAGFLGAKMASNLTELAERQKARIIFIGDTKQLSGVDAGNPFRLLQENGAQSVFLTQGRRQQSQVLKECVDLLSKGEVTKGLAKISTRITQEQDKNKRANLLVESYFKLSQSDQKASLLLAGTNENRDLLTAKIREKFFGGSINPVNTSKDCNFNITTLKRVDLTTSQKKDLLHLEKGKILVFSERPRNSNVEKNVPYEILNLETQKNQLELLGPKGNVVKVDALNENYELYDKKLLEVREGEKLKWTRNEAGKKLKNGDSVTLIKIEKDVVVLKDKSNKEIAVEKNQFQHLDYNYVSTVHGAQGKTASHVFIYADQTFGRESTYVGISRAKLDVQLFVQDTSEFLKKASRPNVKENAYDLVFKNEIFKNVSLQKQESVGKMAASLSFRRDKTKSINETEKENLKVKNSNEMTEKQGVRIK